MLAHEMLSGSLSKEEDLKLNTALDEAVVCVALLLFIVG